MQNTFSFTGTFSRPKEDAKRPYYHEFTKNNRRMRSINFGVKPDKNNIGFVEMFGLEQDVIKTRDKDNNPIEIDWTDRFDPNVLANVSIKRVIDLGIGDRQEFLSEFDAIEYLKDHLNEDLPPLLYSGRLNKQFYQGKVFDKFQLQSVYPIPENNKGLKLRTNIELAYNKDCIDMSEWKEKKVLYIDGYTPTYIDKDNGTKFIPQRLVFNASKIDQDNPVHMKQLKFRMQFISPVGKKMVRLAWETILVNGAETVEFDESMLTTAQKGSIECGLKTLEDYRPRGQIFGQRVSEYRMICPHLEKEFAEGIVDTDQNFDDWESENVYIPPKEETLADVMEETPKKEEEKLPLDEFDAEDIFS